MSSNLERGAKGMRRADIFGPSINFFYNGGTSFTTRTGGFCSLLLLLTIILNLGTELYKL